MKKEPSSITINTKSPQITLFWDTPPQDYFVGWVMLLATDSGLYGPHTVTSSDGLKCTIAGQENAPILTEFDSVRLTNYTETVTGYVGDYLDLTQFTKWGE